jgi:putative membrane protein
MEKANRHIKNNIIGLVAALLWLLPSTQTVSAHDGQPPAPHDIWSAWNWDPIVVLSLILGAWAYAAAHQEQRRRAGLQRSALGWRTASFSAGLLTLFLALVSPLDAASTALFSAHMLQHMLLIAIIPPLLVLGVSAGFFLLSLTSRVRKELVQWWHKIRWLKSVWHGLTQPWAAWALNVLIVWVCHIPWLYQAALENEALHMLEHLSFFCTSLLFWWTIVRPKASLKSGDPGILALFTMALQGGLLGALITFAPTPWYAIYALRTEPWGLSPLEDQQLAGAIMWIPVGMIYTLAALILLMVRLTWIERTGIDSPDSKTL